MRLESKLKEAQRRDKAARKREAKKERRLAKRERTTRGNSDEVST
jgi:hypothetical protein